MLFNKQPPVISIERNEQFEQLVGSWSNLSFLAIDTEFERRTTYYAILALVQVFDGETIYLIDPLKVACPSGFRAILADPKVVKIMHSAKEDLEVLHQSWQCQLVNLFDTQTAYAFVTGTNSIGYAALVQTMCEVTLAKEATQSNWRARPLSDIQLEYAALDVLYLPGIYQSLQQQIIDANVTEFFSAECQEMCEYVTHMPDFSNDYRQAGDVWRLDGNHLALFKLLYQWREETAISEDRTRNHIMKDFLLVQIAETLPQSKQQLQTLEGLHPKSVRLYAQHILEIITQFSKEETVPLKTVANPRDLNQLNKLTEIFLKIVAQQSKSVGVAASIISSKRLARKLAFAYIADEAVPSAWLGWREKLLQPQFDRAFAQLNN